MQAEEVKRHHKEMGVKATGLYICALDFHFKVMLKLSLKPLHLIKFKI